MKKVLSIILAVILTAGCLSGCNFGGKSDRDGKLTVVATIFRNMTGS